MTIKSSDSAKIFVNLPLELLLVLLSDYYYYYCISIIARGIHTI